MDDVVAAHLVTTTTTRRKHGEIILPAKGPVEVTV
jgi:hypothetical protein